MNEILAAAHGRLMRIFGQGYRLSFHTDGVVCWVEVDCWAGKLTADTLEEMERLGVEYIFERVKV